MGKWKCWQNERKTENQPEAQNEDAPSKSKDERKEGESASEPEERREVRKKRARITEVEKLQFAAVDQRKSPRGKAVVMEQRKSPRGKGVVIEQRRPRTKTALHKVLEGNGARGKEPEAKQSKPSTFSAGDFVQLMGYGVGEEEKLVAHGKVKNVEGGTLHGAVIYEGCVSLEVQKSEDDEYVLFKSVEMDDPPLRKIGEAVGSFIMWPAEFLRHPTMQA